MGENSPNLVTLASTHFFMILNDGRENDDYFLKQGHG
jgi:hypothetical protein